MTELEIEKRIMELLRERPMSWSEILLSFEQEDNAFVDAVMTRLDRFGAIRLNRRSGKYERYD